MSQWRVIRRLFRIRRVERDVAEELRLHFELTVEELVTSGHSRAEAEREAGRRFGDAARYRHELERIDRGAAVRWRMTVRLRAVADTIVHALASIRRSRSVSVAIVIALALGIGVNGTMFRIVDRLWLSPPAHIAAPDEVVRLLIERRDWMSGERHAMPAFTYPGYQDLLAARGFADVVARTTTLLTLGHGEDAERMRAELATGGYFRMLGVRASLGRFFDEAEDVAGVAPVVVLSHGYWRRAFGGSTAVLGQSLDFGHGPFEVIGVAPRGFTGLDLDAVDLWLPLHSTGAILYDDQWFTGRGMWWLTVEARLAPGVSAQAAAAEATALNHAGYAEEIEAGRYDADAEFVAASLIAARGPLARPEMDVARWLAIVALLVLLIACLNVANLLLARVVRQRREIGIRLALGVPRGRLVGQLLLEGLVLAAAGGALALVIADRLAPVLGEKLLPNIDWSAATSGPRSITVTVALVVLAGLLSALPPALQASRRTIGDALRTGAAAGVPRSAAMLRGGLVFAQATISVMLLVGAALFVRSLDRVRGAELGYSPRGVLVAWPTFTSGSTTPFERSAFFGDAPDTLRRIPGVMVAGASASSPFGGVLADRVEVDGRELDQAPYDGWAYIHVASPSYFAALGLNISHGRAFGPEDRDDAPRVAIINRTLARAGWPGGNALGGCVGFEDRELPCLTVVGVAEDFATSSFTPDERFQVWLPAAQRPLASERSSAGIVPDRLVVRASTDRAAAGLVEAVRRELVAMDSRVRFVEVRTMREIMSPATRSWELGATLFSMFALLALLLAALGLYAVLAFDVAQRTRELGVRAALGATRPRLIGAVIGRGLRVSAAGILLGLLLARALTPRLDHLLFGVSPGDAVSFLGAAGALLVVALCASIVPASGAMRADPVRALRSE